MGKYTDFKATLFHNRTSKTGSLTTIGSDTFKKPLVIPEGEEKDGPAITACEFKAGRRNRKNALNAEVLIFDLDGKNSDDPIEFREQALNCIGELRKAGVGFVVYTTFSHGIDTPSYRILMRVTTPIDPEGYRELSRKVSHTFDIPAAVESQNSYWLMFMPMVQQGWEEEFTCREFAGIDIDPDSYAVENLSAEAAGRLLDEAGDEMAFPTSPLPPPEGINDLVWVSALLEHYPATQFGKGEYEDWCHVILALAHHFQGSTQGFDLFWKWHYSDGNNVEWFDESKKEEYRNKYAGGVNPSAGQAFTLRSIANAEVGANKTRVSALAYASLIEQSTDKQELEAVITAAEKDTYMARGVDASLVARAFRKQWELVGTGESPATATLKKRLLGSNVKRSLETPSAQAFLTMLKEQWLFSPGENKYMDITGPTVMYMGQDAMLKVLRSKVQGAGIHMPTLVKKLHEVGENEEPPIRSLGGECYKPGSPRVIDIDEDDYGRALYNRFDKRTWPSAAGPFNSETSEIDRRVKKDIEKVARVVCDGNREVAAELIKWIAHRRQYPHIKPGWSWALLSKTMGLGKSTIGTVLKTILGGSQVSVATATNVNSDYNPFMADNIVCLVEEGDSYASIRNRNFLPLDRMKAWVTDTQVSINEKNRPIINMQTVSTPFITSNFINLFKGQMHDRRWMVVVARTMSPAQVNETYNGDSAAFFTRFNAMLENHTDRVVAYFESIDVSDFSMNKKPGAEAQLTEINSWEEMVPVILEELVSNPMAPVDLSREVVYGPALLDRITQMAMDGDEDLAMFDHRYQAGNRNRVDDALLMMGYHRLSKERRAQRRLPFECTDRPLVRNVWVRDPNLTIEEAQALVKRLNDERVERINGQGFEEMKTNLNAEVDQL